MWRRQATGIFSHPTDGLPRVGEEGGSFILKRGKGHIHPGHDCFTILSSGTDQPLARRDVRLYPLTTGRPQDLAGCSD